MDDKPDSDQTRNYRGGAAFMALLMLAVAAVAITDLPPGQREMPWVVFGLAGAGGMTAGAAYVRWAAVRKNRWRKFSLGSILGAAGLAIIINNQEPIVSAIVYGLLAGVLFAGAIFQRPLR